MNWRKGINILATSLILIGQGVGVVDAFAVTSTEATTEDLTFKKDNQQVSDLTLEEGQETTISLTDAYEAEENAEITLPASVSLNQEATNTQLGTAQSVTYNAETNKVTVAWGQGEKNVNLVLKGNQATGGTPQQFFAKVVREGTTYRSQAVNLTVTEATPNSSSDTNQDQEESSGDDSEDGEISNTEPVEEATEDDSTEEKQVTPQPRAGNLNVDLDIAAVSASISSGEDAVFTLNFKVTGSQTTYTDANITVDIPKEFELNQELSELAIAGVIPTRDETTGQLIYSFDSIAAGQTYTTNIKVKTTNGTTPNGTAITLTSNFSAAEFSGDATSEATTTVKAGSTLATSKSYVSTTGKDGKEKKDPPTGGDTSTWKLKVNAAQKDTGITYFKEGSKIVVKDTLPDGLTYVSDDANGTYDKASNSVTWTFDAPSYDAQVNAVESLFSKEINIKTKFNDNVNEFATFENKVNAEGTDINDKPITSNASAKIMTGPSDPSKEVPAGSNIPPYHNGPRDGIGNVVTTGYDGNPDPTVYDTALLTYKFYVAPDYVNSPTKDFTKYNIVYNIDPNLNLVQLNFSTGTEYKPYNGYPGNGRPISSAPRADVFITVNGEERQIYKDTELFSNKKYDLSLEELGLKEGDHVSQIRVNYTNAPAGMNNGFYPSFHVKKGFTGKTTNTVQYDFAGYNSKGEAVSWSNSNNFNEIKPLTGARTAEVVSIPPETNPIAKSTIKFDKQNNGVVEAGNNRIIGTFGTDSASALPLTKPLSAAILLPVGTKVDTENPEYKLGSVEAWDEATTDGHNQNGTIEIVSNNYNNTNRQLVKVTWNDERIYSGDMVNYGFNTIVEENAPSPLRMDTYGYSGDDKISVPDGASTLTDSYLEVDKDDLNGDGNTTQSRVLSSNQYRIVKENKIKTSKLVKGDLDGDYSKMGHATPGGTIDYQLNMENQGNTIGTFVLMDVLPSVGDLGITDNMNRGSQFTPTLTGPISLPEEWTGKVTVQYSEATNPSRSDLNDVVNYPETTEELADPDGATEANWKAENQVSDWSKIHSFKITLNNGEWTSGNTMALNFQMKAPNDLSKELTNKDKDEQSRAAWNSFAYTAENSQVVEPERVGVVVNAEEPDIHKDIEDSQHLDLSKRDQAFDWHVNASFGNTTSSWTQASIVDQINPLLTIQKVTVVDENGTDVTGNGKVTTEGNKVVFELNKQDDSFTYLAGHTYTMTITTVIGEKVTDEQLAPYIKDGGIPNQADLNFGNEGDVIHSEIPTVTPPTEEPDIHKDIEEKQHLDLNKRDQAFDWHVNASFGNMTASWEQASIVDQINPLLTIQKVTVVDENGEDVTGNGKVTTEGNKVVFELNKQDDSFTYLAGHTYTMTITTVIGEKVTDEQLAPYIKDGGIPNQADLNFGNEGDVIHSEIPTVTPPTEEPDIHKDIEEKQHLDLSKRDQAFDWHVNASFGNMTASWEQASIVDQINPLLTIQKVAVVDENGEDVTGNGKVTTEGNKVVFELNKQDDSFTYLAGHTYTMTITTVIGEKVTDEQLAPYIKDGGIPNQADLNFGNEGDVIHSEIPTVTPPTEEPDIHKDIEEKQHLDLSKRDQAFDWHVNASFGNMTASWEQASIVDQINPLLTIQKVTVVDENGTDVTGNGKVTTEGNKVVFELNKQDDSFTYLAGHTYTMTITTVIGEKVTDEQLAPYIKDGGIPNQADLNFGNEGDVIHSEIPTVTPPTEEPDIHKDIEEKQHLDLSKRDQAFDWHVNASFGNMTASWEQASIVDQINPLLTIQKVTVVDGNGEDVTGNGKVTTEGNKVVFELNKQDDSFTYLAGHTYTMTITTVIGEKVTDEQLAPYIKDGGIPNQADLNFGNEGDVIHSEIPTVTPPTEEPDIHKDIEEKQHLDLSKRDQAFDWHVNASFGNMTASWEQASIVDQINPLLTIQKVAVVDENGTDVTGNGKVTTEGNKVVFELNKQDDSFTYLAGHTYTMTITTVIGEKVTDEQLAPYIKDGGIPNQADLNFGNEGDVIHSEIPTVTPPTEEPDIHKDIEEKQHLDLSKRDQAFDWHVNASFGNMTASWEQASIVDQINPLLTIQKVAVVDENGEDVTGNGKVTTEGNKVVFELNKQDDSFTYLAGHTYTMTITTVIGEKVTDEQLAPYIKDGGIPNQADLNFGNEGDVIHSEIPTVTPPTEEPDIHKDIEEKQHLDLSKRDQAFDWHVNASFGNMTASWEQASIVDQINPLLTIQKVTVVDGNGEDVTGNGKVTTEGNKVVFELNKQDDSFTYLAGHTYTMTITTVIGEKVTDEQLAPYIKDGGIPNQADLNFGNEGDVIHSEIPTVTPPTEEPDIHKDIEEKQHLDLSKRDQAFDWHVNASFGNMTASWEQASIVDQINPLLTIQKVTVVDENGTDVTGNGTLTTEGNKVVFELNKKDDSFAYLAGHTYTMTITTTIGEDVTDEELAPYIKDGGIPNQADLNFGNEGDVIQSEIPTITPPSVGMVILDKVDEDTGKHLAGAEFELQNREGKTVQRGLVSNKNGQVIITGLTPGDYQLVETKAPDGYKLDKTPVKFTIKEGDYTRIEVEKTNKLLPSTEKPGNKDGQLPKTGEQNSFVLYVIGFGLLIFVGLLFVARRGKAE
jgi:fimbrial isopeptide formation D2 family protein/LPXTG-motif cell wall-anchored protein